MTHLTSRYPVQADHVVARSTHEKENPMTTVKTAVQTLFVTLLLDRRAQAAVALTLALVAGALLGPDAAEAGKNLPRLIIANGPH